MDNPAKYDYTLYIIFLFENVHFYILLFLFGYSFIFKSHLSHSNSLHFFQFGLYIHSCNALILPTQSSLSSLSKLSLSGMIFSLELALQRGVSRRSFLFLFSIILSKYSIVLIFGTRNLTIYIYNGLIYTMSFGGNSFLGLYNYCSVAICM